MDDEGKPKEPAPEDHWSALEKVGSPSEGAILVGFLEAHGIPARVVDRSFHQTPTGENDLTPIEVAVPTARLAEAMAALDKREDAFEGSPTGSSSLLTDDGMAEIETTDDEKK